MMNYREMCNACEPCYQPNLYACCQNVQPDPLYPVPTETFRPTKRRSMKPPRKTGGPVKSLSNKKRNEKSPANSYPEDNCEDFELNAHKSISKKKQNAFPEDVIEDFEQNVTRKSKDNRREKPRKSQIHPDDCCCSVCSRMKMADLTDFCDSEIRVRKETNKHPNTKANYSVMANASEKNIKNYLYDNPDLRETKSKKESNEFEEIGSDDEVWLLQCPKNYDPKQLLSCELGKLPKQSKVECRADRFFDKKTLVVIAPEKAAEYQIICDNLKLVNPVGKIVISEKYVNENEPPTKKAMSEKRKTYKVSSSDSNDCESEEETDKQSDDDECDECDNSDQEEEKKRLAGKKVSKNVKDQRFTIETTLTVEKKNDKKRGKNQEKCLPFVPPEPSPIKKKLEAAKLAKKNKSTKGNNDLGWMNC